ncbi:hypothetical protein [Actinoplanes sp. NPDC051494]|uniref:hypothetical protein n=1 Tax=Actinoplanes sp. NPDC051494 TaxID=3363907 RepID=UPI003790F805
MSDQLTAAECAALDAWQTVSADTTGMLCAVRAALRQIERSEDARLAVHERTVAEIGRMVAAFDTPHDSGRVSAFVGDLRQILLRLRNHEA